MKNALLYLCFVLIGTLSCKKDASVWQTDNLNGNTITIFGHGGMGIHSLYPLDSYESISKCIAMGADGSEMDLQMSKDSVLFVYHSQKLEEATSCHGVLFDHLSTDLTCEYTSTVHKNIRVIRFHDLLEKLNISEKNMLTLECKLNGNSELAYLNAFANVLIAQLIEKDLLGKCLIESTNPDFLAILKSKNAKLRLFLYTTNFEIGLITAKSLNLFGMTFDMFKITKEQIEIAHENNLRIALFNQKREQDNVTSLQMNPDFIQTDKLKHLLKIMGKYRN
ncbi:MAG: glycerophosphodiester phosphodiesterase family protein [bacterium]|nr:glycerophosphodiester phosphodiesterase family protein [bacterium]